MSAKIAIVGAGAVGLAMAAEYALAGHAVYLGEIGDYRNRLSHGGEFSVEGLTFSVGQLTEPRLVQTKLFTDLHQLEQIQPTAVIVATTAHAHEQLLPMLAEVVNKQTPLIIICGNGSTAAWLPARASAVETNTAPYGVRRSDQGIGIKILTPSIGVAGSAVSGTIAALEVLQLVYPQAFGFLHCLDGLLSNPNPLMHPTIMLANLTRIERGRSFTFYQEGVTDAIRSLLARKNLEREAISRAIGGRATVFEDLEGVVMMDGQLVPQSFLTCGAWSGMVAPTSLTDRYFTEDVPFGLVVWEALGRRVGQSTPIISAEIEQVSTVLKTDFRAMTETRTRRIISAALTAVQA